jgi:hypothetical protein
VLLLELVCKRAGPRLKHNSVSDTAKKEREEWTATRTVDVGFFTTPAALDHG